LNQTAFNVFFTSLFQKPEAVLISIIRRPRRPRKEFP
jgi:hypothetical protein